MQQQKQQQLPAPPTPKPLAGRKRSFTQACTWDNLGPKALSEISASLLAAGGWEGVQAPAITGAIGVDAPGPIPVGCSSASTEVAEESKQAAGRLPGGGNNRKSPPDTAGCSGKGRRGPGGAGAGSGVERAGKRPLNPERMERKASREKRRREEVCLLQVQVT